MTRHHTELLAIVLALAATSATIALPSALATHSGDPVAFHPPPEDGGYVKGDTVRACANSTIASDLDQMRVTWQADPISLINGPHTGDVHSGPANSIVMEPDGGNCITLMNCLRAAPCFDTANEAIFLENRSTTADGWDNVDPCHCLNVTGRWSVYIRFTQQLTQFTAYTNFSVSSAQERDANLTGNVTLDGADSFDIGLTEIDGHLKDAFWLSLAVVFLFNGWLISGTGMILGGLSRHATANFPVSESFAIAFVFMMVLFELLVYRWPQTWQRFRDAFDNET